MAVSVDWQMLRDLAGFRAENGCALSLYLDLDPSDSPTPKAVESRFNSLVDEVDKTYLSEEHDRERKLAIRADVERLRTWWVEEYERDGANSLAIFASSGDGFFRVLALPESVPDRVDVDRELTVSPLVGQVGRTDGALVAVMSRERGEVYALRGGRLEEIVDETEDVPGRHDEGGWSQARYQRHIEKLVQEHLQTVGDEIDKRVRARALQLVIVAPEELRSEIEAALSSDAKEAIVGWATAESHADATELLEVARPHLDHAAAVREQDALDRWHEEIGKRARGSAGWHDTLEAASDARVDQLLLADGVERVAYRCPQDGRAYAEPGTCPLDGSTLEEHDGVDLAVHQTLAHGGTVLNVGGDPLGGEGIGALLRF